MSNDNDTNRKPRPCFTCYLLSLTVGAIVVAVIWRWIKDGTIHF